MTDAVFFVIEERPKSARRGLPCTSIKMLSYRRVRRSKQSSQMVLECSAYAFQVSVNHIVRVEIVETPRNSKQLSIVGEHGSTRYDRAGELTSFILLTFWLAFKYCGMLPRDIHLETIQSSNNSGATPSTLRTLLCLIRLQMTTSLQNF